MERIREEKHLGKTVHVLDLTGLTADAYPAVVEEAARVICRAPPASVLLASVVKDLRFGREAREHVKAFSARIRPHVKASAVVGLSPLHQIIFLSVKPFLHGSVTAFATLDQAKAWLVRR